MGKRYWWLKLGIWEAFGLRILKSFLLGRWEIFCWINQAPKVMAHLLLIFAKSLPGFCLFPSLRLVFFLLSLPHTHVSVVFGICLRICIIHYINFFNTQVFYGWNVLILHKCGSQNLTCVVNIWRTCSKAVCWNPLQNFSFISSGVEPKNL